MKEEVSNERHHKKKWSKYKSLHWLGKRSVVYADDQADQDQNVSVWDRTRMKVLNGEVSHNKDSQVSLAASAMQSMTAVSRLESDARERMLQADIQGDLKRSKGIHRTRIHLFLGMQGVRYQALLCGLIIADTYVMACETDSSMDEDHIKFYALCLLICRIIFTADVGASFLVTPARKWTDRGYTLGVFLCLVSVVPAWVNAATGAVPLVWIQMFVVLRVLTIGPRIFADSWVLYRAIRMSLAPLLVPGFFLVVAATIFSFAMYHVEWHEQQPERSPFPNVWKALWFMFVTFTTVGYGDVYPETYQGRHLAMLVMVGGVLMMAMPLAIVGANFTMMWNEKESAGVVHMLQDRLGELGWGTNEVLQLFEEMDHDKSGLMEYPEFKKGLQKLKVSLPPHKSLMLFKIFDEDNLGTISVVEFINVIMPSEDIEQRAELQEQPPPQESEPPRRPPAQELPLQELPAQELPAQELPAQELPAQAGSAPPGQPADPSKLPEPLMLSPPVTGSPLPRAVDAPARGQEAAVEARLRAMELRLQAMEAVVCSNSAALEALPGKMELMLHRFAGGGEAAGAGASTTEKRPSIHAQLAKQDSLSILPPGLRTQEFAGDEGGGGGPAAATVKRKVSSKIKSGS